MSNQIRTSNHDEIQLVKHVCVFLGTSIAHDQARTGRITKSHSLQPVMTHRYITD